MKTFSVLLEHEDGAIQYLIDAEEIVYTTGAVCLLINNKRVAYFRRDKVISITREDVSLIDW